LIHSAIEAGRLEVAARLLDDRIGRRASPRDARRRAALPVRVTTD
jgi:hypothetical protein